MRDIGSKLIFVLIRTLNSSGGRKAKIVMNTMKKNEAERNLVRGGGKWLFKIGW